MKTEHISMRTAVSMTIFAGRELPVCIRQGNIQIDAVSAKDPINVSWRTTSASNSSSTNLSAVKTGLKI